MAVVTDVRDIGAGSFWRNEFVRGVIIQIVAIVLLVLLTAYLVNNTMANLEKLGKASGFGFIGRVAGFQPTFSLIPYNMASSSYARVFLVGVVNTLVVSAVGIVFATFLGFLIGVARLSTNFLVRTLAAVYVDVVRNIPLLVQIIFWYVGVLSALPPLKQSLVVFGAIFLNVKGLYLPAPIPGPMFWVQPITLLIGIAATVVLSRWARRRQVETGQQFPIIWAGLGLIVGLPLVVGLLTGFGVTWSFAELKGFNFRGGMSIMPEFVALLAALTIYTAAFIAEIVRAGIQAVSHGQTEAAHALGLRSGLTIRLVILPQALRVIVPPLTSQYLNLTKNSTLGVIIAYPDVVAVWAGTVLNQTGQAVEVISITMAFYLVISLLISAFMNWYNRRIALVER